ncbi:aggregation-promoting factor C-terminal-like domain-containing protein [Streptomyces tubercidicus]|uniref:aggregation-promoting factor C-terminal-like domain-containing protein n=1 Tax=Streptomyces tubercidicus TaxID=47759 RepID=UPI00378E399D
MPQLDVVGTAAVDIVPIIPQFHAKLKAAALPVADRVGMEMGRRMGEAISNNLVIAIPAAINQGGNAAQTAARRQGDDVGGAFSNSIRRKLEIAFKAMPKLDIRLGDTGINAELARLRAQMETLSKKRIGVDIDAMAADVEFARIEAELTRLGENHPNIAVRVDTAAARAALAEIRAEIAAVDAEEVDVKVDVDTGSASAALMFLGIQMAATAAIPLGPVIAAGLGAVVSAAAAAGAGIGALGLAAIPSISAVKNALTAQKSSQDDVNRSTDTGGKTASQAAQKALQMASAQQALAAAHRNAASSVAQANRQVEDAERGVAQATQRAAEQRRAAADGVKRAEQSLADANHQAKQAEDDLTAARADAARQLRSLNDQLADGALNQREATLRLQQAQADLQTTMADPKATQLQRDQAQLSYDQAAQSLKEQQQSYKDLQKSAADQRKAGVDGNQAVKAAAERVQAAQRGVVDQTRAVADAQRAATKAQVDGAQSISDAQRRVSDAVRAAADAQVKAADSVKSAERGVQSARLSGTQATAQAATKVDAYGKALAKLTPEQRRLFDSIAGPNGLKSAFDGWQKSLQGDVVPIFTRGVGSLKRTLPSLRPLVKGAASGIEELQTRVSKEIKTPFWQDFKKQIQKSAKPAIVGLGVAFGNVLKGMAGVVRAFLPHMGSISSSMQRMTKKFADWGKGLKGSPAFERFLRYARETAPRVGEALGKIFGAVFNISKDLSPISGPLLTVIGTIADFIGTIAEHAPWMIQIIYAVIVAVKLWTLAQIALNLAMDANPITLIILAIAAVVAIVIYCYNKFTWFKNLVDTVWRGISAVIGWVWRTVLKPTFDGLSLILGVVGDGISWLWKHIVSPVFGWIGDRIKWVYQFVIKPQLMAFKWIIGIVGDIISWLWQKIVSPIFGWIGERIKWVWRTLIQPNIQAFRWIVGKLGDALSWLWEHQVKPVFKWIGDKAAWLWNYGVKPSFNKIKDLAGKTGDAFQTLRKVVEDQWSGLVETLKTPAKIIIDTIYNHGIVPLWNGVASVTGAGKIKPVDLRGFHTGGIMPGYTPGVDNQIIAVGGGEAIMRPEWTRAVGPDYVNSMNAAARSGGVGAVRRAVGGGMPAFSTGGIVGAIQNGWDLATDPLGGFDKLQAWISRKVASLAQNPWVKNVGELPGRAVDGLKRKVLDTLGFGSGDMVGRIGDALKFAVGEAGKPYQWGGVGNPSWDCSGFMGAIQKVIEGRNPKGRIWSTFGFNGDSAPAGWKRNLPSPFQVGITNRGKGHTAGTLAGVNVESRGGDGVVVGNRARGAHSSFFDAVYGFAPALSAGGANINVSTAQQTARQMLGEFGWGDRQWGPLKDLWQRESGWRWNAANPSGAYGIPQSLPGSKMASVAADWRTNPTTQIKWGMKYIKGRYGDPAHALTSWLGRSPHWYDQGGYLQPGMTMVANGTGKPEPVFTAQQWDVLKANVGGGGTPNIVVENHTYIGDRELTEFVDHRYMVHEHATARAISDGRYV